RRGVRAGAGETDGHLHHHHPELSGDGRGLPGLLARAAGLARGGPTQVGIYGESEGAWIAPIAAVAEPGVAYLVLVSAPIVPPREQFAFATDSYLRNVGVPEALLRAIP